MELKLVNGEYIADGSAGLAKVSGAEEVAQRILMKLSAKRGRFPLMPEFGSNLYKLPLTKQSERSLAAEQYIAEALEGEDGVSLRSLDVKQIDDDCAELSMIFDYNNDALAITTRI